MTWYPMRCLGNLEVALGTNGSAGHGIQEKPWEPHWSQDLKVTWAEAPCGPLGTPIGMESQVLWQLGKTQARFEGNWDRQG